MKELLKIDNLIVSFRDDNEDPADGMTAVRGVSLAIGRGETLALVGESGCGKTVLCKSMMGFLCNRGRVDAGSIEYMGEELVSLDERALAAYRGGRIAMIPQDPMTSLDPLMSVGEQIAEVFRITGRSGKPAVTESAAANPGEPGKPAAMEAAAANPGEPGKPEVTESAAASPGAIEEPGPGLSARQRALSLMKQVGIEDAEERYDQRPYQFSGGMRQRIVIAIALAGNPSLVLADEPTTALDEKTRSEVLQLIRSMQDKQGFGMLFITHDLHLVADMAQRVAIMKDGHILEEGPVEKVFTEPSHDYTKQLLGYLDYYRHKGHIHRAGDNRPESETAETESAAPESEYHQKEISVSESRMQDVAASGSHHQDASASESNMQDVAASGSRRQGASASEFRRQDPPALVVRRLNKSYGSIRVLSDFDLEAYSGEILGIVGRSGCGKSTLASCIMGIEPYGSGTIEMPGGRDSAQMIFQATQDAFNDRMTIAEIIGEPIKIRGKKQRRSPSSRPAPADHATPAHAPADPAANDHKINEPHESAPKSTVSAAPQTTGDCKINEPHESAPKSTGSTVPHTTGEIVLQIMGEVGLDRNLARRKPYELSGGQRQRAAIARALIADPDIIIADEPLTGLDITSQAKIVHLLRDLVDKRGLCLILIAHDLPMVEHVSDRIIRLDQ